MNMPYMEQRLGDIVINDEKSALGSGNHRV